MRSPPDGWERALGAGDGWCQCNYRMKRAYTHVQSRVCVEVTLFCVRYTYTLSGRERREGGGLNN